LLLAEVPAKVVSERLGHASVGITLDTCSHVLPTMQKNAATAIGTILTGSSATQALQPLPAVPQIAQKPL
jgi:hypothetical protein